MARWSSLVLVLGCRPPLPVGTVAEREWLVAASEVVSPLEVPCAGIAAGDGPFSVTIDDGSGFTVIAEPDQGRLWLRDPFGVVASGCFWEQAPGHPPEVLPADLACASGPFQTGTCTGDEDVSDAFRFFTPGVRPIDGDALAAVDGVVLVSGASGVDRLDLTPSAWRLPGEDDRSFRWSIGPVALPEGARFDDLAAGGDGVVGWDTERGRLHVAPRVDAGRTLDGGVVRGAPSEPGVLAAAGDFAVIGVDGAVHVYEGLDGERDPSHDKRAHPALDAGIVAVTVHPGTGYTWALIGDTAVGLPSRGQADAWPVDGALGLLMARPALDPIVYAWGNVDGHGVLYRLEAGGVAVRHDLHGELLAAGIGASFQEIVTVERGEPPIVRSWLDRAHLDAMPPGTIGVALAVFVESPRDEEVLSVDDASSITTQFGLCDEPPPPGLTAPQWSVCCVHGARGEHAGRQLAWLDERLDPERPGGPAAAVFGVNPAAFAPSRYCEALGVDAAVDAGRGFAAAVLDPIAARVSDGTASAAVFLHNSPYGDFAEYSFWLACPDTLAEDASSACTDWPVDADTQAAFYRDLAAGATSEPWIGDELDWTLIGGSFEGVNEAGLPSWVEVYRDLVTPDGASPEHGFYFGLLAMDPRASGVAGKELAPEDARTRAYGLAVGSPVSRWDDGSGTAGIVYWPGNTFALPWLFESRAAGLLFGDYTSEVAEVGQWATPAFEGEEDSGFMTHADFAVQEHYLMTRVVAEADVLRPRWFSFHLQNLTRIREESLQDGWITCYDAACADTALDRFIDRVTAWGPAIRWSATPSG